MCRISCRREESQTRRKPRCNAIGRIVIVKPNADKPEAKPGSKPASQDDLKTLPLPEVEKKLSNT